MPPPPSSPPTLGVGAAAESVAESADMPADWLRDEVDAGVGSTALESGSEQAAEGGRIRGPVERCIDHLAVHLGRAPRWLLPVNVAAATILAWWSAIGLEQASDGAHLGSTLTLVFGVCLTMAVAFFVRALEKIRFLNDEIIRAAHSADIDPLTGLANRRAIASDIEDRLQRSRPRSRSSHRQRRQRGSGGSDRHGLVGVLFCDLDRLKVVNDSLGHEAGDRVLQVAAKRIAAVLRTDDAIGRFAGDKFVVVTSGLPTTRDLELLAQRLVTAMSQPTSIDNSSTQVISVSIGIAWSGGDDNGERYSSAADLLRDADSAMQIAKSDGGATFAVFEPSVRARAVARLELEQDLRRGIKEDEIVVHYQPIIDVESGEAERYEALVRWNHPVRGMIHPADFLSVAAESSLIVEIGNYVLHRACRQAVRWSEMTGRTITVAVNVAERQLLDLGLVGSVTRALAESGLPPRQLELEITEELIMERLDRALLVLRQLELAGVKLVIDDFGTSQASLARLQSLAMVSTLKIDRVFVEGLTNQSIDRNIVTAIVSLASSIGMSIVAEGVEQAGQAAVLRDLGVRYQQGFLYQRPGPPEVMTRHLQRLQQEAAQTTNEQAFNEAAAKAMLEASVVDQPATD